MSNAWIVQPDIVMDEDDSKDGSNAEEEEAVDPLEEHEKRLRLAREKGEADKTEAKNWLISNNQSSLTSCADHSPWLFYVYLQSLMLRALNEEK